MIQILILTCDTNAKLLTDDAATFLNLSSISGSNLVIQIQILMKPCDTNTNQIMRYKYKGLTDDDAATNMIMIGLNECTLNV